MPNYDYECNSCGHKFEVFQSINAPLLNKCPECGKKVKRLIGTGAGIIFKGSGFYATDYKKQLKSPSKNKDVPKCPQANNSCANCPKNH